MVMRLNMTTVDLPASKDGEEGDDSSGNQCESNAESENNEKMQGKSKMKDSHAHNNEVAKILEYNRWIRDNTLKNSTKRHKQEDRQKTFREEERLETLNRDVIVGTKSGVGAEEGTGGGRTVLECVR